VTASDPDIPVGAIFNAFLTALKNRQRTCTPPLEMKRRRAIFPGGGGTPTTSGDQRLIGDMR